MQKQQGAALLIVLLIVAVVSVLAAEMGGRLQLQVQRAINIKDSNQAYWYAIGAEEFARKSIAEFLDANGGDPIHIDQPWSQDFIYPVDGGGISASLTDLRSCFNINALANSNANATNPNQATPEMEAFGRMLRELHPDIDSYTADTVRDSLADWLDEDDNMRPQGAEDSEYESRTHPYLAANRLMTAQSELRMINGVSPGWFELLLPSVCVIPSDSALAINVNTVTDKQAPMLAGLLGTTQDQAKRIIGSRPRDGWTDAAAFLAENDVQALSLDQTQAGWFTTTTDYFMLHTKTKFNEATFTMSSVFHAKSDTDVRVVRREFLGVE